MARVKVKHEEKELDIQCFMNLMIVLVPSLLLNMQIASTSVLDLKLPAGAGGDGGPSDNQQIELILHKEYMVLNYPAGVLMSEFPNKGGNPDMEGLSQKLRQLKPAIEESIGKDKKDILILSEPDTSYQTLVSAMDTVKSYETVVVTDVVEAELFPEVSLGDAPMGAASGGSK